MKTIHPQGLRRLALAVCRQWVYDHRPQAGRDAVETYANLLVQSRLLKARAYYNQAEMVRYKEETDYV